MLKNKERPQPEANLFEPSVGLLPSGYTDVEPVDTIAMTGPQCKKAKLKSEAAKMATIDELRIELPNFDDYQLNRLGDVSYNETIKYWAAVYSLSIDEERAIDVNGIDQVRELIDNKLSTKYGLIFDDLCVMCCHDSGLQLMDLDADVVNIDDEIEDDRPELLIV